MKKAVDLSVLIVNHNAKVHLMRTLGSVVGRIKGLSHEVIVVDNASTDGSVSMVKRSYPSVKIILMDHNAGFAKANNLGAKQASGRYFLVLNSDTEVPEGTAEKLVDVKEKHPDWGVVAPIIHDPDGSFQLSWGRDIHLHTEFFLKFMAGKWYRWRHRRKKGSPGGKVDWVSGACFLIESSLYRKVGGFDEKFFLYLEDADLGKRVRQAGYDIRLIPEACIIHHSGRSVAGMPGSALLEAKRSQLYYYCKHNSRMSSAVLRFYLLGRFGWKKWMSGLKGNTGDQELNSRILAAIKEFRCEDPA